MGPECSGSLGRWVGSALPGAGEAVWGLPPSWGPRAPHSPRLQRLHRSGQDVHTAQVPGRHPEPLLGCTRCRVAAQAARPSLTVGSVCRRVPASLSALPFGSCFCPEPGPVAGMPHLRVPPLWPRPLPSPSPADLRRRPLAPLPHCPTDRKGSGQAPGAGAHPWGQGILTPRAGARPTV